ncbi:hypothetical protein A6S26_34295 [Nostoc sp. ATCC 43529]|nr:hypothetical protein A6S26_34295 [Nostoc sp. ATCC 43529]
MKKITAFVLAFSLVFSCNQVFANEQHEQDLICELDTSISPSDAYDKKVECLFSLKGKRLLTNEEIAFLIDWHTSEELYNLGVISLQQKRNLETNRI